MSLIIAFDSVPKGANWPVAYLDRDCIAPSSIALSEFRSAFRCEADGSYAILSEHGLYRPSSGPQQLFADAHKRMVEFGESQVRSGKWVRLYIAPSSSLIAHMSEASLEAGRRGAVSSSPGVITSDATDISAGLQRRVALSQISGFTDAPSQVMPRTTLPPTSDGSITTSPSDSLVIGAPHPVYGGVAYHYTDNPQALSVSVEQSMPRIEAMLRSIENRVPGSELTRNDKGLSLKHNKHLYGTKPGSKLRELLTATLGVHHEGQVDEALEALMAHAPNMPASLVNSDPYGPHFLAHHVSLPTSSGVSALVRIVPKEMMPIVEQMDKKRSSEKDWNLPKVLEAKKELEDAITAAYSAHRERAYSSFSPIGEPITDGIKLGENYPAIYVPRECKLAYDDCGYQVALGERYVAVNQVMRDFASKSRMIRIDESGRIISMG
jgi:hypothetical protein